ncbi:MAG: hypothetical protein AB1521_06685 [Bacteroidota bacterium]
MNSCLQIFFFVFLLLNIRAVPKTLQLNLMPSGDTLSTNLEVFQTLANEWKDAYNNNNLIKLSLLYSENSDYISSHVNGLVTEGRDNIIAYFGKGIELGGHIDSIEILKINLSCDIATLFCKYEAKNCGEKVIGRNLLILKRIKDKWQIIIHMTVV